jgi:prepilin-type N-terminal cleavage/methylation domain-containing protein/prepilin-type processing-associated H-X9-DG protein
MNSAASLKPRLIDFVIKRSKGPPAEIELDITPSQSYLSSRMRSQPPEGRNAFTIIELMVVIAIIAVLFSLLAPALGSAKRKAMSLACKSKVRQWGLAFKFYIDDNNDALPWEGTERQAINQGRNISAWYNVIPPKMGKESLIDLFKDKRAPRPKVRSMFNCPITATKRAVTNISTARPWFMYGMNGRIIPNGSRDKVHEADIVRPDQTILFTDNHERHIPITTGAHFLARHDLKSSVFFFDGHVETVKSNILFRTRQTDGSATHEWATSRTVYWFPHSKMKR